MSKVETFSTMLAYIGLLQTFYLYRGTEGRDIKHHEEEIEKLRAQHNETIKYTRDIHLKSIILDMQRHFQQLNADLLTATRASENDMYDQRNKQCQTLILAATIMLSALVTMLIQGILPSNIPNSLMLFYGISSTLSLGLLFLCIIIYVLLVTKCSNFMYEKRSMQYTKVLRNASDKTIQLFIEHADEMNKENILSRNLGKLREDLQDKSKVNKFLEWRDDINNDHYVLSLEETFDTFWSNCCDFHHQAGVMLFYFGTIFLLVALIVYNLAYFKYTYEVEIGGIVSAIIIGSALGLGVLFRLSFDKVLYETKNGPGWSRKVI